jgi:ATP-dependent helicase/nuclease subunit A
MTRAEDELYVTGALTKTGKKEGTWYEAIENAVGPDAESTGEGETAALVYPRDRPRPEPIKSDAEAATALAPLTLRPLPAHRVREIVRPSLATGKATKLERVYDTAAEAAYDAETARKRGIALHALLQHLPKLHAGAFTLGPPLLAVVSVAGEKKGEAHRRLGCAVPGLFVAPDRSRFKPGKCHRHAHATQKGAAGDRV